MNNLQGSLHPLTIYWHNCIYGQFSCTTAYTFPICASQHPWLPSMRRGIPKHHASLHPHTTLMHRNTHSQATTCMHQFLLAQPTTQTGLCVLVMCSHNVHKCCKHKHHKTALINDHMTMYHCSLDQPYFKSYQSLSPKHLVLT